MAETKDQVIALARTWLGTPYHHQASVKGVGCDCIGLVRGVYAELTGKAPPSYTYSGDWGDVDGKEHLLQAGDRYLTRIPVGEYRPGDVIALKWKHSPVAKHCMIVTGTDTAIHAYEKSPVTEIHLSSWWQRHVVAAFSFPEV